VVGVDGAAATILVDRSGLGAPLPASNPTAAEIEELQFTLGEGPSLDAHQNGRPVAEPDLENPQRVRWPVLTAAALDAGAAAIFSFPVRVGGVRLGALRLHQSRSGRLSDTQHADAMAMADLVLRVVLAGQVGAAPGELGRELESASDDRAEVHQAAGMVSAQLSASVADGLVRLRARAFGEGRPLAHVAGDIVARRIRFVA